jgi:hypothetical protein
MPALNDILSAADLALVYVVLAGLFVRQRARSCWTFTAYIVAVTVSDTLMFFWPDRFYRRDIWIFKETVLNLLKLLIAVELMVRIFGAFPSAYASARRAVMIVLLVILALAVVSLSSGTAYQDIVGRLYPHVNDGTVWLLVAIGGYSVWYHLPIDSLHKAILIGLVPFLLLYSVVQRAVVSLGWERAAAINSSAPLAYAFLLAYWAYAVWRKKDEVDAGQRVSDLMMQRTR